MRKNQYSLLFAALMVVALVPAMGAAQAAKTPWGDPDLQGIWSNPYVTPLERPKEFGTRAYLTQEEIAAAEKRLVERAKDPGRDKRDGAGTEKDVARAYNNHWFGDPSFN